MEDRLRNVLRAVFDISDEDIHDGTGPANVGLWDSLNHLRMVTELEKEFRIRIPQKEIRKMVTVAQIRETVGRHLSPGAGD